MIKINDRTGKYTGNKRTIACHSDVYPLLMTLRDAIANNEAVSAELTIFDADGKVAVYLQFPDCRQPDQKRMRAA
jgi:hypothetical protein